MEIEKSPSSRAICGLCNSEIKKGDLRIKITKKHYGYYSYDCYHIECVLKEIIRVVGYEKVNEIIKSLMVKKL